jgi:molybdopterin-guanine dinucleotide biosynthesis protein A
MSGDKGLMELSGEPLVSRVVNRVSPLVDEVLLVLGSEGQRQTYSGLLGSEDVRLLVDLFGTGSPLVGALTGFKASQAEYALVTACDMPFISPRVVGLLFDESEDRDGAFFEWPNGWIEPLLAVYRVEPSLRIAKELYREENLRLRMIMKRLPDARSIPISVLKGMDPDLLSLFDADTEGSLVEAEKILEKMGLMDPGV